MTRQMKTHHRIYTSLTNLEGLLKSKTRAKDPSAQWAKEDHHLSDQRKLWKGHPKTRNTNKQQAPLLGPLGTLQTLPPPQAPHNSHQSLLHMATHSPHPNHCNAHHWPPRQAAVRQGQGTLWGPHNPHKGTQWAAPNQQHTPTHQENLA